MAKTPVRYKRVAEAFDDVARARLCGSSNSSGSEHSPENSLDLSDLVKSFLEKGSRGEGENAKAADGENEHQTEPSDQDDCSDDSESKETLRGLFGCDDDEVKQNLRDEVEQACRVVVGIHGSSPSATGFKRRLMTRLRDRGFDAGLCKSKWERNGRVPSGSYEYIDVNVAKTRYIVAVSLSNEFQIARATSSYTSLLENFPPMFVGRVEELKKIVRLMCNEMKRSMKSVDMHVPPWRRHAYMQAKWFGCYKRTTNEVSTEKKGSESDEGPTQKRWVGFEPSMGISYQCREYFGRKVGVKVGKLAVEFGVGASMLM